MLQIVYACIFDQHDLRLVALAALVCLFACFSAVNLFADAQGSRGRRQHLRHAAAATVFGAGVWTTHFIAELAYRPGIPIGYDIDLTLLSIAVAIVVTWIGMWIALHSGQRHVGGAVVGAAIGAMHYTGIAALRAPADLIWDPVMVVISVLIGATMAAAAIEFLGPKPGVWHRIAAAAMLVLAIVGLHFTAMAALTLKLDGAVAMPKEVFAPDLLAIAIAAVAALIITLGLACSFVDDRLARRAIEENQRLQKRVAERTAELHEAQDALVRQEKLSVIGQLTATIAHELRNPLGAIGNTIYLLRQESAARALDFDRPIGRIERSVARCERIINGLIGFTETRPLEIAPVAVNAWLGELLDARNPDPGITIERHFCAPDRVVPFDRARMQRAIANVLDNAVQAMSEPLRHGRVPRVIVTTLFDHGSFEITIEDNGPGIPAAILPQIFEPLFSTKSFGTGLGLPTVKQIIKRHGGTIDIASAGAAGTRVALRLPLVQPTEMAA